MPLCKALPTAYDKAEEKGGGKFLPLWGTGGKWRRTILVTHPDIRHWMVKVLETQVNTYWMIYSLKALNLKWSIYHVINSVSLWSCNRVCNVLKKLVIGSHACLMLIWFGLSCLCAAALGENGNSAVQKITSAKSFLKRSVALMKFESLKINWHEFFRSPPGLDTKQ